MIQRIEQADGLDELMCMPAGEVALMLFDPPWGATKAKWDRPLDWRLWWPEIDRVLAPSGVRLAVLIVPDSPRRFAYDLVWKKNRKSGHLNAKRAPLRAHESLLVFGDSVSYSPQLTHGHPPMQPATRISKSELYGRETVTRSNAGSTDRYQSSVLEIDCVANDTATRIHPSQTPVELWRWLILAYSKPGDLVVDPCCGSGSAIQAARLEGRRGVGFESDPEMAAKAQRWLAGTDSPLFGRERSPAADSAARGSVSPHRAAADLRSAGR